MKLHDGLKALGFLHHEGKTGRLGDERLIRFYEFHVGAFSLQVRHEPITEQATLNIAYRASEPGKPMRYRPWSIPTGTHDHILREVSEFLRIVTQAPANGGD